LFLDSYYPGSEDKGTQSEAYDSVASHHGVPVPFYLAAANLPRITVGNDHAASVYQILRHDKLVLTLEALGRLEERLKNV
jgi:ribosomal protein L4